MSNDDTGIIFKEGFLQTKVYGQTRWQRRYCIIDWDKAMLFIALKNDRKYGDYVKLLPRVLIMDSEIATDLMIEIVADTQCHYLLPESKKERDDWLIALKRTAYSRFGGGIFGQSLADTYRYACGIKSPVPVIIQQCCEFLLEHGTTFVGLFRVPGKQSHVRELRDKYDRCQLVDLNNSHSPATIASLLKIYLQSLPEPVIPMKYFDDFLEIGTRLKYDSTKELENLKNYAKSSLPKINFQVLAYLCLFLRKLTAYAQETKMDTENLSIAFGSNLIRASDDLDMNMIKGLSLNLIPLIKALIDHSEYIFFSDENESSEKTDESIRKSSGFSSFSSLLSSTDHTNLCRARSSSLPTISFARSPFVDSANFSFDGRSDDSSNQFRSQSPSEKSEDHTSCLSNSPQSSTTYIQGDHLIVEENDENRWTNSVPVEDRDAMNQQLISKDKRKSAISWQFGSKNASSAKKKSFVNKVGKSFATFTTNMSKAFIPHGSTLEATSHGHTIDVSPVRPEQRRSVDSNLTDSYLKILHDEICVLKGIIDKKEAMILQLTKDSDEERLQHRQENSHLQSQIEQLQRENSQLKAFQQADN